jgi:hypothetical protein
MIKMVCPACDEELILVCGEFVRPPPDDWDQKSTAIIFGYSKGVDVIKALCPNCTIIREIIE